jgi:hypothetical protein
VQEQVVQAHIPYQYSRPACLQCTVIALVGPAGSTSAQVQLLAMLGRGDGPSPILAQPGDRLAVRLGERGG